MPDTFEGARVSGSTGYWLEQVGWATQGPNPRVWSMVEVGVDIQENHLQPIFRIVFPGSVEDTVSRLDG